MSDPFAPGAHKKVMEEAVAKMESQFGVKLDEAKKVSQPDKFNYPDAVADPRNDLRMAFLRSQHDMVARLGNRAGIARDAAYKAYGDADSAFRLSKLELEAVRKEIEARYEALKLDLPIMYHARTCECEVCDSSEHA